MKRQTVFLAVMCVWEGLFFLLLNTVVKNAMADSGMEPQAVKLAVTGVNLFLAAISLTINVGLLRKVLRLKPLLKVSPRKCIVEDFIVTDYRSNGERKYKASLLVKDPANGQLLFTYGDNSLLGYNSSVTMAGNHLMDIRIFRKDGSVLQLGDPVEVYVKKYRKVAVDWKKDTLRLNKKPFSCRHSNPDYTDSIFRQVTFYEGAAIVE